MDYICYGSPISEAKDYMEEYLAESDIIYPSQEVLAKGSAYKYLSEETSRFVEGLYQNATKTVDTSGSDNGWIVPAVLIVVMAGTLVLLFVTRKRRKV
jgi:spermidine/putrescine-binding protein